MRSVLRAVLAAGLALSLSAAWAQETIPVAPSGPWSAYFAGQPAPPEALAELELDAGSWPAFLRIMDRTTLQPQEALSASDAPTAAALVKKAAVLRLDAALADVSKLRGEKFLTSSRSLKSLHDELRDFRSVQAVVPWFSAVTLQRDSGSVTAALHRRAMREAEARLKKAAPTPGSFDAERIRKVESLSEGAAADWTIADAILGAFGTQRAAARAAIESTRLIGPEKVLAAAVLVPRQARLLALEYKLARSGGDGAAFARTTIAKGKPIPKKDREWLESLRAYVPGLEPSAALAKSSLLDDLFPDGSRAGGWAMHERDAGGRDRAFIWVSPGMSWLWRVHTAAHEGFHQGDAGYAKGRAALALLLGDRWSGQALFTVLIEGYTEFRARDVMEAIYRDGLRGRSGLAGKVSRAILKKHGTLEGWRQSLKNHGYTPYVEIVKAVMERPGGRDALEAYVRRGEVGPLVAALGPERLEALGRLGSAYFQASGWLDMHRGAFPSSRDARAAAALGLGGWLQAKMLEAVRAGPQAAVGAVAAARLALKVVRDRIEPLGARAAMRSLDWLRRGRFGREPLDRAARRLSIGLPREDVAADLTAAVAAAEGRAGPDSDLKAWLLTTFFVAATFLPGLAQAAAASAPVEWLLPRFAWAVAAWVVWSRLWSFVLGTLSRRSFLAYLLAYLPKKS